MLYAGISSNEQGYRLAVLGRDGLQVIEPADFPSHRVEELIARLRGLGPALVAVESTNGTVDGRLMAAGLTVHWSRSNRSSRACSSAAAAVSSPRCLRR